MRFLKVILDIIGTAGDVQSISELVDILKDEAPAYWISSLSVLILLLLLLLVIRLRVYLKLRNSIKESSKKNYSYSELRELYDEKFPGNNLTTFRIVLLLLLAGLAFISMISGIAQLIIFLKYS